jgi:hypothetical protein
MTLANGTATLNPEDLAPPLASPSPEMPPPPGDEDGPGGGTPPPLRLLDPSAWGEEDPPPLRYLLEGLLPLGAPAILASKSNAGKSFLAMEISFAVATGRSLFGRKGPDSPQKVLFVELEDDEGEIKRRWRRCRDLAREDQTWGAEDEARLKANWRAAVPDWTSTTSKALIAILPYLQAHADQLCRDGGQLGLIVLDTFASLSEGEENKAEVQRAFWAACYTLANHTGGTPLIVHHVRKPPTGAAGRGGPSMAERLSFDTLRGSSAIVAGARAIIQVEPVSPEEASKLNLDEERAGAGNYLVLALTKNNAGPKGAWIALEQRQAWDPGAGFFTLLPGGDHVCATLRSKAAVARLTLEEAVLLSIAELTAAGGEPDRKELARKHWPGEAPEKAAASLKSTLSHLRTRRKWLQKGIGWDLTWGGVQKVKELQGSQGAQVGDPPQAEDVEPQETRELQQVSSGSQAGDLAPKRDQTGETSRTSKAAGSPGPGAKVSKSPTSYKEVAPGLETLRTPPPVDLAMEPVALRHAGEEGLRDDWGNVFYPDADMEDL